MVNTGFSEITQDRLKYFGNDIWYLEVAITGKCNFNCNYCNRFSANLDLKSFYKVLKSNNKIHHIQVTGGEPTTHPEFFNIMNYCREHCLTLGLSTNGSAHIHTYMRSQADRYSISFDDYLMDELIKRGYKNPISILLNIIRLIKEGYYVDIGLVIDERNVDRIEEIIKYLLGLGVNDIKLSTSTKSGIIPKIVGDYPRHPILNYRVERIKQGLDNRGKDNCKMVSSCGIAKNDVTIVGKHHYPCLVYFREGGSPIGEINQSMMEDRLKWSIEHDTLKDPICSKYCMDFKCEFNKCLKEIQSVNVH